METVKQFQMQQNVRNNSEDMRNVFNDILKWQTEIKEKEKALTKQPEEEISVVGIRTNKGQRSEENINIESSGKKDTDESAVPAQKTDNLESQESSNITDANACKVKGNHYVKLLDYDQAIYWYNEAIKLHSVEPIFFTNRALCYLKLERYDECIVDCKMAIELNPNTVKAFYRRMQAYETLGENKLAFADCTRILELEPKNADAKRSSERIKKRLKITEEGGYNPNSPKWTKLEGNISEIGSYIKPPHIRSKKQLRRVKVEEYYGCIDDGNDNQNIQSSNRIPNNKNSQISDEVIDKLFNHNDCGSFTVVKKSKTENEPPAPSSAVKLNEAIIENPVKPATAKSDSLQSLETGFEKTESNKVILMNFTSPPKSSTEFYATWKELSTEQKYAYFKTIDIENINKILGAGFDYDTFSGLLALLSEYYTRDSCDVSSVLKEILKHPETKILSFFISNEDRGVLEKVVNYMRSNEEDSEDCMKRITEIFQIQ